jgi:S1-C subfamily serine protease
LTESSVVPKLGVVAMTVDKLTATTDMNLRVPSGVVVAARTSGSMYVGDSPEPGDVIHSLNNHPIGCLEELQSFLTTIKSEGPVVLQVERRGEMLFLVLEAS